MAVDFSKINFYFDDPRLRMSLGGRFLVRVISLIFYLSLIVITIVFLLSNIASLFWAGILLAMFLIDQVIHINQARVSIYKMPKKDKVNLDMFLAPKSYWAIERAYEKSLIKKTNFYLEILNQLLDMSNIKNGLIRLGVDLKSFKERLNEDLEKSSYNLSKSELLGKIENLVKLSLARAIASNDVYIEPKDIFAALGDLGGEDSLEIFPFFNINPDDLNEALIFDSASRNILGWRSLPSRLGGFVLGNHKFISHRIMNRAWTSRPTYELDKYSIDYTDLARQGKAGFLIGHQDEYERLVRAVSRPINPNVILVGDPSIGKETLISHLAFQITRDNVPQSIFDKRLVGLRVSDLIAGAPPEEIQKRLQQIVREIILADNIILYIPEIHNLLKTSGEAYLSAADALLPIIQNNTIPVIGSTYYREFKEYIEPRSDFLDIFEVIRVSEISQQEAVRLLIYESLLLESKTKIKISFSAVKKAVELAKKYFSNKFLPGSAEDLLKDALMSAEENRERVLTAERVVKTAEDKTKIPISRFNSSEAEKLLHLEELIHQKLIDQEEAVKAVSESLREYRSGLLQGKGPIASFLFVGPTGVGKTELSKILADIQFGSEDMMIRFDMSEYQDKTSFFRFIGSPDGKISGSLTEAVLAKPYSLILLDEFEKAYPDILNLFLQVFDDGRLTDNLGRTVDFKNTIIIATSNAHSDIINQSLSSGESMTDISDYLKTKLSDVFKPELLNRFTKIIIFKNLSFDDVFKIAALNLNNFAEMLKSQGITLIFGDEVIKKIAQIGYDPAFGARPIKRAIDENLKAPLSEKILNKEIVKGVKYKLLLKDEGFSFEEIK